jgi:hypothetical protein
MDAPSELMHATRRRTVLLSCRKQRGGVLRQLAAVQIQAKPLVEAPLSN